MKKEIYNDISNEIAKLRYDKDNLPERLKRRIRRKFQENIEKQNIEQIIHDIGLLYSYTSKRLPKFTMPSTTGYAEPQFVKINDLIKDVKGKFPKTSKKVLSDVAGWVVYWEYLR